MTVPFNRRTTASREAEYVQQALDSGHLAGDGPFTVRCQELLEERVGARKALLTTSCTHALEMSALLLDVGPGDEVLVPAFTFVSTANAIVLRGAAPVFVDVDPATGNIDPDAVEAAITPRTRAVLVVHYAGVAAAMDRILAVGDAHELAVVEDAAHALFATWRGQPLGSLGHLAAMSFHVTKNVTCGEGGALLVNDPELVDRAEIVREKGTNRSQFVRGEIDRYVWKDVGSSYLPSDVLAAILAAQLEEAEEIQAARARVWKRYEAELGDWASDTGARMPVVPDGCEPAWHSFHLLLPTEADRDAAIEHLQARGITAPFHYPPLHLSDMGRRLGGEAGACPVAESFSACLIRLPLFTSITDAEVGEVVEAVRSFRPA